MKNNKINQSDKTLTFMNDNGTISARIFIKENHASLELNVSHFGSISKTKVGLSYQIVKVLIHMLKEAQGAMENNKKEYLFVNPKFTDNITGENIDIKLI